MRGWLARSSGAFHRKMAQAEAARGRKQEDTRYRVCLQHALGHRAESELLGGAVEEHLEDDRIIGVVFWWSLVVVGCIGLLVVIVIFMVGSDHSSEQRVNEKEVAAPEALMPDIDPVSRVNRTPARVRVSQMDGV